MFPNSHGDERFFMFDSQIITGCCRESIGILGMVRRIMGLEIGSRWWDMGCINVRWRKVQEKHRSSSWGMPRQGMMHLKMTNFSCR